MKLHFKQLSASQVAFERYTELLPAWIMLTGRQATPCTRKIFTALHPWRMYCFSHPWRKRLLEMCTYGWLSLPLSSWYCLLWKCPSLSTWQVPDKTPHSATSLSAPHQLSDWPFSKFATTDLQRPAVLRDARIHALPPPLTSCSILTLSWWLCLIFHWEDRSSQERTSTGRHVLPTLLPAPVPHWKPCSRWTLCPCPVISWIDHILSLSPQRC